MVHTLTILHVLRLVFAEHSDREMIAFIATIEDIHIGNARLAPAVPSFKPFTSAAHLVVGFLSIPPLSALEASRGDESRKEE